MPTHRISIIIPAFNEANYLPRLLDSIEAARGAYARGAAAVEVIVADNASTDATARIARDGGARVVRVDKRAIAAARNGGARVATGGILAFVDADTLRIHARTFDVIEDLMSSSRFVAGATGIGMERWSAGIAATYALMIPMVWLTRMDTGVVFCRREDFVAVGGYDEARLVAEDLAFLLALRRLGRRRGQRLVRARRVKAVGSTRKFDEHGDWHYLTMMPRVAFKLLIGKAGAREAVLRYWYEPRR
ncbi:MAG TPA: glycosyltransferase [Candidatus Polarisedimenticolia bacterium]|jgi:glycosyltransferase involved in cell wall biosynthesis